MKKIPRIQRRDIQQCSESKSPPYRRGRHIELRDQHKKWQWFRQPTSFEICCTVPVPIPSDLATFKIPTPFASCLRTFRSVAISLFGRPSFTPWVTAWRCSGAELLGPMSSSPHPGRSDQADRNHNASVFVSISKRRTEPDHSGSSSQRPLG
jgi:hypothetical protein